MTWIIKESNVLNFLSDLAKNPELQEAYQQDPESVMDEAGLSEDEKAILTSERPGDIIAAFADQLFKV